MKIVMKQQGRAPEVQSGGKREPRPYAINQNYPSQLGSAIDPKAAERFRQGEGFVPALGPTDGMGEGPGANRETKPCGSQGSY